MRVREPEAKQRRLLDAALLEFAAGGLAGTAVDAIADRALCSPGLIYSYFGGKERLFDAVMTDIGATTVSRVPMDATDLPGYAVRLFESNVSNPEVTRFVAWYQLERSPDEASRAAVASFMDEKVAEIEKAQADGMVRSDMPAAHLVLAVQSVARMWSANPAELIEAADPGAVLADRAESVRHAVAALVAPTP